MALNPSHAESHPHHDVALFEDLRRGFFVWELLRVPYNLALGVATIVAAGVFREHFKVGIPGESGVELALAAVAANLLYTLGPAAEMYLYILVLRDRGWRNIIRVVVFLLGTVASVAVAYECAMIFLMEMADIDLGRLSEVMPNSLLGPFLPVKK